MTQTATPTKSIWNKVTFTGNLGKDPDMHFTNRGTAVTKFSIAVSQGKDKPAMWLNVECWKTLAEHCNEKLQKGSRVELEGRLVQDVWDDKEGNKRYTLKVVAETVRLLKRAETRAASGFIEAEESEEIDSLGDLSDHPF